MIRNLLILLVFLGFGFAANVAQSDIFVRQNPKAEKNESAETQKKTNIFLRPFQKRGNKSEQMKERLGNRLELKNVRRKITDDMRILAYWQQRDRAPENIAELQSYAVALRSENLANVLQKRIAVTSALEAAHAANLSAFRARINAQAPNQKALEVANAIILEGLDRAPSGIVQTVYKNYDGQVAKPVPAALEVPVEDVATKPTTTVSKPSIAPIYRKPADSKTASESEKPSKAADRVYKNYR